MEPIRFANSQKRFKSLTVWTLELALLFGVAGLAVLPASAAPKTGPTGKTSAQCKADLNKCVKVCNRPNIMCITSCDLAYSNCDPSRGSGRPVDPLYDPVPIQPRSVEGDPATTAPAEKEDKDNAPAPK